MTYPVAIVFCALSATAGFCFWAWLKSNEAQRLSVQSAALEQLAARFDELDKEQARMADHYGNALQRYEGFFDDVPSMAKDISRLDSQCARADVVAELTERMGLVEARFGEMVA